LVRSSLKYKMRYCTLVLLQGSHFSSLSQSRFKHRIRGGSRGVICILVLNGKCLAGALIGEILFCFRKTKWAFLERVQKTGAAPTRAALMNQCRSDAAVLDTLCEAVSSLFVLFLAVFLRKMLSAARKRKLIILCFVATVEVGKAHSLVSGKRIS
jgi:hypothetical protein